MSKYRLSFKERSSLPRDTTPHPKAPLPGRPLLGQGRRQEAGLKAEGPSSCRMSVPGLIQLPQKAPPAKADYNRNPNPNRQGHARESHPHGDYSRSSDGRGGGISCSVRKQTIQRTLYDPANPNKPILVGQREGDVHYSSLPYAENHQGLPTDLGSASSKPSWYETSSER